MLLTGIAILLGAIVNETWQPTLRGVQSVESVDIHGNVIYGNGVQLKDYFLTSAHVVNGPWKVGEHSGTDVLLRGETLFSRDFVLLDIQQSNYSDYSCNPVERRDRVFYRGDLTLPDGKELPLRYEGRVITPDIGDTSMYAKSILVDMPVTRGMSGGAIYDRWGRVIGVTSAMIERGAWSIMVVTPLPYELCPNRGEK